MRRMKLLIENGAAIVPERAHRAPEKRSCARGTATWNAARRFRNGATTRIAGRPCPLRAGCCGTLVSCPS